MRLLKRHWPIIPILIVAAVLRWYDIGADYLDGDHAFISIRAIRIARYHETPLLGPPMAVGLWHSPVSVYLYAIPYSFSLDPRVARAFTGLMNVIALGLMYALGARYFNRKAALAAALLYAIHPDMITAARAINNAQLGAPFAVAYVFTGLLGYCENKRPARLAHLPLLSLAGQCHPHTFAIAPISVVLLASAWLGWPNWRRQIIFDFLVSGLIAAVLLAPWGIGSYQFAQQANLQSAIPTIVSNKGLTFTFTLLYNALGGSINGLLRHVLPVMTIFGAVWLVARFLRNRKEWPSAAIVMGFFCLPITALLLKIHLVVDYFWPTFPIAFLIPGLVIGGAARERQASGETSALWKWNGLLDDKYLRWIAAPAMIALAIAYLPYVVVHDWSEGTVSLNEQVAALDVASALARKTGRDLMIVVPNDYDYLMPWELLREIEHIETGRDARVILPGRGMPLPQNGSVLLGPADYADRPDIFSGGVIVFQHFRIVELPPADRFVPDLVSPKSFRLSNGATIFGFLRAAPASLPTAGQSWRVFMIWRVDSPMADEATVFAHLVNERGDKYAQLDMPALPTGQQRAGEWAMNLFDFQLGDGLPVTGPLYVRFGMYDSLGQAQVLDVSGNATGDYGLIQIRGQSSPLAVWDRGLALDTLVTNSPLMQGPPLDITATWFIFRQPAADLRIWWRLVDADRATAYETTTGIISIAPTSSLPVGMFASAHYSFWIPTDIAAGSYTLEVQLIGDGDTVGRPYRTGIEIAARNRNYEPPPTQHAVNATFGQEINLLGYDLGQDGRTLQLVLHWKALGQIARDYKYFVHVWGDGQVRAQVDGVPDNYQYYTSWWAANEAFSETVSVDLTALDAGTYTVTTGFYDPTTGQRLPPTLADGTQPANAWVTLQSVVLK